MQCMRNSSLHACNTALLLVWVTLELHKLSVIFLPLTYFVCIFSLSMIICKCFSLMWLNSKVWFHRFKYLLLFVPHGMRFVHKNVCELFLTSDLSYAMIKKKSNMRRRVWTLTPVLSLFCFSILVFLNVTWLFKSEQ